jgi:Ca2+-transporting ATPase
MRQKPRDPKEQIMTREKWLDIVVFGLMITAATIGLYWVALNSFAMSDRDAATIAFLTLALSQLWHVFNMRDAKEPWIANTIWKNPYVWLATGLCLMLLGAAFYLPVLAGVMDLARLDPWQLGLCLGASVIPLIAGQCYSGLKALWSKS